MLREAGASSKIPFLFVKVRKNEQESSLVAVTQSEYFTALQKQADRFHKDQVECQNRRDVIERVG